MMEQQEAAQGDWTNRPWVMAGVGAVGGLMFHQLVDGIAYSSPPENPQLLRMAGATFVAVATVSFLISAERRRLPWALGFAIAWGAVMALVGYFTASYDRNGEIVGFPFLSGLLAVGIAAPLFQTVRDEGAWRLPYESVHRYAWTDAIIGGASLAFTALTFLLAYLLATLFDAIGIALLKNLLDDGWFGWTLAGTAFGAASAVLRERDPLLGTLQKLVMVVFSVLAPVLAFALAIYVLALPATGFAGLWKSGLPETPLLLSAAAFSVVLLNAIIGDSPDDRGKSAIWRFSEWVLLLVVLPLGILALISMGLRVGQHGWTPERLWGVIACLVAITYGVAAWIAAVRARNQFDRPLRESQKHLAVGVCGFALLLALPLIDFGAISTRSQLARLESGAVAPDEFDYTALAFDFGPAGRHALRRLASQGSAEVRPLAAAALTAPSRWQVERSTQLAEQTENMDQRLRITSPDIALTPALKRTVANRAGCDSDMRCALVRIDERRVALLVSARGRPVVTSQIIELDRLDPVDGSSATAPPTQMPAVAEGVDLASAPIEVRDVKRRQVYVDGKPVGEPFE